jgi:hypothetical protein
MELRYPEGLFSGMFLDGLKHALLAAIMAARAKDARVDSELSRRVAPTSSRAGGNEGREVIREMRFSTSPLARRASSGAAQAG